MISCLHLIKLKTRLVKEVLGSARLSPKLHQNCSCQGSLVTFMGVRFNGQVLVLTSPAILVACHMIAHFLLRKTLFWKLFRKLRGGVDTFKSLKFGVRQIKKWEVGRAFQPCVRTRGRLAMVGMEPAGRWMCGVGGGRCRRAARAGEGALRDGGGAVRLEAFGLTKGIF